MLLSLGLLQLASLATASPLLIGRDLDSNIDANLYKRIAPPYCGSGGFSRFASVLVANSASSFCSGYLSIQTVSIPVTDTLQTYKTATATIDEYKSTTVVVATRTSYFTVSTTVNTVPTTVATRVTSSTSTITSRITPPATTETTTVWYTPGVAKRDGPGTSLPRYVAGFAPPAISSGCSCLDIPTPSTTGTEYVYHTNTVPEQVTRTITNTIESTLTISTTSTIKVTFYVPVTSISTSVIRTTTTVTVPTPTSTSTISSAIRPQCTAILAKQKIFVSVNVQRSYIYPFTTTHIGTNGGENSYSQCCELCYRSTNCAFYYLYPAQTTDWRCQIISSYSQVNQGITAQCPLGRLTTEGASDPRGAWALDQPRGIGPCFGFTVPV
ncbi:hypothetical protein H072_3953 [Dactylellina haptotyla CBS 200.50]|uniref:Apple domain-containing protein n=1 Tax=Dactylellina haptotyla (strain CBS 200.50) TaxID=1284197 RepID=S8AM14_DACHA|nr:hypothetical protein H072_3953 [Dactylellina haptotyla CBS 200.50]